MVSESDPEGRIVAANAAFLEASGYRLEELVGQKYGIFNSNLHNPEFFRVCSQSIERSNAI